MLKSRKITGLSPSDGLKTTLLDRLQFVGDKPGMLPIEFWLFCNLGVFGQGMAVLWNDLRKSRSFLGIWGGRNPGSGAKRRRTGRGQESPATKALGNKGR
jgi:hypothetical protein